MKTIKLINPINVILFLIGFVGFILSTNESDAFFINIIGVTMLGLSVVIFLVHEKKK